MNSDPGRNRVDSCTLALIGSGGAGVMTAGQVLLDAAVASGWYGLMTRSTGPQIRGGEAAAIVRLADRPVNCQDDRIDLLVALDFDKAERFAAELILDPHSRVIVDPAAGPVPDWIAQSGATVHEIALAELLAGARGVRANSIAVGLVSALVGLDPDLGRQTLEKLCSGPRARAWSNRPFSASNWA
jgi:2-oxoglutarate/2-oxoacid ferredoxin oxidoreductase subunit alpha